MLSYYHVDAFSSELFRGNPAGVCPLPYWLPDEQLQCIAAENNLSETAFYVREPNRLDLRWFTPTQEVDLCGHATLAAAHVIFFHEGETGTDLIFETRSGPLSVTRGEEGRLTLDFPSRPATSCTPPPALISGLGATPLDTAKSRDYLAVFENEAAVAALQPDFSQLASLDCLGIIVTAPGEAVDFVSRFFAPGAGVSEDPVTGSAHCTLIPYWAERLQKTKLNARQISQRTGELCCELKGDRVQISGHTITYLTGTLHGILDAR